MVYYTGVPRQAGGGLGGIFRILTRTLIPAIARSARPFIKNQARRALPSLAKAGLGLVSDIKGKRNFKQAVRARGKRLASDVIANAINQGTPPTKRQKRPNQQTRRSSPGRAPRRQKKKTKKIPRDVFA